MAAMTHVQGIRIARRIREQLGPEEAEAFCQALPLSKSLAQRKIRWAKELYQYLEGRYSPEEIRTLRAACSCWPAEAVIQADHKRYLQAENLDTFCRAYQRAHEGQAFFWREGESLYLAYPQCYCNCVKRSPELLSPTWRLCTAGDTQALFEEILGCPCQVELLESIKQGQNRCLVKIARQ